MEPGRHPAHPPQDPSTDLPRCRFFLSPGPGPNPGLREGWHKDGWEPTASPWSVTAQEEAPSPGSLSPRIGWPLWPFLAIRPFSSPPVSRTSCLFSGSALGTAMSSCQQPPRQEQACWWGARRKGPKQVDPAPPSGTRLCASVSPLPQGGQGVTPECRSASRRLVHPHPRDRPGGRASWSPGDAITYPKTRWLRTTHPGVRRPTQVSRHGRGCFLPDTPGRIISGLFQLPQAPGPSLHCHNC